MKVKVMIRKIVYRLLAATSMALTISASGHAATAAATAAEKEVAQASKQFRDRMIAKDAKGAAAFYAEDVWMQGGRYRSRAELEKFYQQSLAGASIDFGTLKLVASNAGDVVLETAWVKFPADNTAGKMMLAWQKQSDGSWKIAIAMLNSDQ